MTVLCQLAISPYKINLKRFFFITKFGHKKLYHKRKSEFQSENIKFLIEQFHNIILIQYCENNLNLINTSSKSPTFI